MGEVLGRFNQWGCSADVWVSLNTEPEAVNGTRPCLQDVKQPLFIVEVWLAPGSAPEFVHG